MLRVVGSLAACVVALALASCDHGTPPAAEQMSSMGLPAESALQVNEETVVTVRMAGEAPELLIFTPNRFGGDEMYAWPAASGAPGGLQVGNGFSLGIYNEDRDEYDPGFCYVFGAGQGPIEDVTVDDPAARSQVVNPEIGGWVIVMSEDEGVGELNWQLIGSAGDVIHDGRGFPGRSYMCANAG